MSSAATPTNSPALVVSSVAMPTDSPALLVSGSPVGVGSHLLSELAAHASFVLAVDAGAELLASTDITPHLLIGDFDSLRSETLAHFEARGVVTQSYDPYKNATDVELALDVLFMRGYRRVIATNVLGGRSDHALGSLAAFAAAANRGMEIVLRDEREVCFLVCPTAENMPFTLSFDDSAPADEKRLLHSLLPTPSLLPTLARPSYVSLIAWGGAATVTFKGMEWPLYHHVLTPESALGISNELRSSTLSLEVHEGPGIVLLFLIYQD